MPRSGVPTRKPSMRRTTYAPRIDRRRDTAYEMSNGRTFISDDGYGGVYAGAAGAARSLEDGSTRLMENGDRRICE